MSLACFSRAPWCTAGLRERADMLNRLILGVVRNYTLAAASHSSKLGPASFAPGLGSAAPSA